MKVLRIQIYQPQAHYRIPFTYQRRHTYPIPPYSTVIGLLCNVLGIDNQEKDDYMQLKKIKLSIAGRFETKATEYVWFRNLSKRSHIDRFHYIENRFINGHIEHIGGQSPVSIDVLNDVQLVIYIGHESGDFIEKIKSSIENPAHRLDVLHLGRAEDWIVFDGRPEVFDISEFTVKKRDANYRYFFWIPEKISTRNEKEQISSPFDTFEGLLYNLPTFSTVQDFEKTYNRNGVRSFSYIKAKLNDGIIRNQTFLFDDQLNLPIFLGEL